MYVMAFIGAGLVHAKIDDYLPTTPSSVSRSLPEIYQEVRKIFPQWDTEFKEYVNTGEGVPEFIHLVNNDPQLSALADEAAVFMAKCFRGTQDAIEQWVAEST